MANEALSVVCLQTRRTVFVCIVLATANPCSAVHQTDEFSPVLSQDSLPYRIELRPLGLADELPTLHSFAKAQWDGKWLLLAGRTNGLHEFTQNGFINFPPAFANREVWVIDPQTDQTWHRSLDDASAQLTTAAIDSLSVTNNQFYQDRDRLYMTGGYGYLRDFDFVTFDTLTAIDVPGLMDWVQGQGALPAQTIRQVHDPLLAVTGGGMHAIGGTTHLVFGQEFQGEYTFFGNGEYTNQVRSFQIVDDGVGLSITDAVGSATDPAFRRRDLNVVPVIRRRDGELQEELVALSGVFTPEGGSWTIPVEIDADGTPRMADASDPQAFKQAMNAYHSAKLGLFAEESGEMHILLFGGISGHWYDHEQGELVRDDQLPFINQVTSVVVDEQGNYRQHLLDTEFPALFNPDNGRRIRFGTNAEFLVADGIGAFENGVLELDELTQPTTLGYIYGGIAADRDHRGNTVASNVIFAVDLLPVPEPSAAWLAVLAMAVGAVLSVAQHGIPCHPLRRRREGRRS